MTPEQRAALTELLEEAIKLPHPNEVLSHVGTTEEFKEVLGNVCRDLGANMTDLAMEAGLVRPGLPLESYTYLSTLFALTATAAIEFGQLMMMVPRKENKGLRGRPE